MSSSQNPDEDIDMDAPSGSSAPAAGPSTSLLDEMEVDEPQPQPEIKWPEPALPDNICPEDDEIAYTLPIYISHSLSSNLHLFQYPLHHRPIALSQYAKSHGQVISARMKEKVGRFEVEIPVDQREEVWNADAAEGMGFVEVEERVKEKGRGKGKSREVEQVGWGTKMRLRGEEVPGVTGYWSGVVHGGALHIHPITRLLQLRPSLGYLDVKNAQEREREAREKLEKGEDDDDEEEDDGAGGGEVKSRKIPDLKAVQLQMAQQPEDAGPVRPASKMGTGGTVGTTHQIRAALVKNMQKEAEDNWVPWDWDDNPYSRNVTNTLAKLLVPIEHGHMLKCKTQPLDVISKKNIGQDATL